MGKTVRFGPAGLDWRERIHFARRSSPRFLQALKTGLEKADPSGVEPPAKNVSKGGDPPLY